MFLLKLIKMYCDDCNPNQVFYNRVKCNPMEVLHERRCAKYIYVVPEGLRELMSDITREVLRCQPKEVHCFIVDYLDALLVTRENAKVAALFVDDVTEAGSILRDILYETHITKEQAVRAVRIIQRAYRRHLSIKKSYKEIEPIDPSLVICKMILRLNITYEKASEAASIIQHAWKVYRHRMEIWRHRFDNAVDWKDAARYSLRMYKKYAATWEYTKAATIIQAAYRGYYTRRLIKSYSKSKDEHFNVLDYLADAYRDAEDEEEETGDNKASEADSLQTLFVMYDPVDKAARIIQRTFKKYIRKRSYETQPDNLDSTQRWANSIVADPNWAPDIQNLEEEIKKHT